MDKLNGFLVAGLIEGWYKNFDRENKETGEVTEGKYRIQVRTIKPQAEGSQIEMLQLGTDSPELYEKFVGRSVILAIQTFGVMNGNKWYLLDDKKNIEILNPKPLAAKEAVKESSN